MRYQKWLPAVLVLLITACSKELPAERKSYIGLWKNNEVSILITAGGRLESEDKSGSAKTSISAPITKFTDDKITAGILFLTTDFTINRQPKEENGIWSVVIDGKELFKTDELGRLPQAKAVPSMNKIREMVTADLRLLSKGIKSNDFSDYIGHASLEFRSQFSNAKMRQLYKPLAEKELNLERFMVGDFALTSEPSISPQGVLTLKGKYPTTPVSLKFDSSYVYVHPEWKTLGVNISVGKD